MSTTPFELLLDVRGRLTLKRAGEDDAVDVRIRRAFPWTDPSRYISIRTSEGKELMLIDDLAQVDANQRTLIEQVLGETSFIPRIQRVHEVDISLGYQSWRVDTDRGPAEFRVQEREDIRFLPDGRFSIKDADGNVYEMARLDQLDDASRKAIEALV